MCKCPKEWKNSHNFKGSCHPYSPKTTKSNHKILNCIRTNAAPQQSFLDFDQFFYLFSQVNKTPFSIIFKDCKSKNHKLTLSNKPTAKQFISKSTISIYLFPVLAHPNIDG